MPAFAILVLVALFGGGTSLAAQNSMPGDLLYGVKIDVNEKIAEAFQFTPQAKADFEAQLAGQRLNEATKLAAAGKLTDAVKAQLDANFKVHADRAEQNLAELKGTNAIATAGLASDFEASLRSRHDILNTLTGSTSTLSNVDSEIEDVLKIKHDAENKVDDEESTHASTTQEAATGKINAAANVIDAAGKFIDQTSTSTAQADARAKLADAQSLEAQAKVAFTAGDFSKAFSLAQGAIRRAQEINIAKDVEKKLDLSGLLKERGDDGESRNNDTEDRNATSSENGSSSRERGDRGGDNRNGQSGGVGIEVDD